MDGHIHSTLHENVEAYVIIANFLIEKTTPTNHGANYLKSGTQCFYMHGFCIELSTCSM